MATEMGSPTKKDDFEPPVIPFKEGCRALFADCHRPAIKPPPSFDSDTNLPLWRRKVDLYLANIPTDNQGPYILSLLSDNVQEVLWASDLSTTATATAIWSKLEELYPVPDNRAESRTTFWSRRQLLGETVEDYANQLRVLVARAFPDAPKETKDFLVFERFLEGIGDLPTRRRFIQEPPTNLSCAIRLARSYAKSAELVPERDGNCMSVKPLTVPIPLRNHIHAQHWDPPRWNRGTQGSSRTHQRPWGTVVPGDGRDMRPPMGRWPERRQQRNRPEQVNGECSNPCRFYVPSVNTPRVDPAPCINVRLGSGVVNALLDTGASCSLLRPEFTQGFHRRDDSRKLKAANGTILRSLGVTRVPVVINGVSVFHDFVVSEEIPWEAIIGCDFLKRFSCTVDFDRQVFRCGDCELPLTVETPNETEWDIGLIDVSPEDLNDQIDSLLSASKQATTASNHSRLHSLISKRAAAFAWEGTTLGRTKLLDHRIHTESTLPIRQHPRRVPVQYRETLENMIEAMLKDNIIRPSNSPWASPVVLVKKKDGSLRLCVDYRRLNDVTQKDSFPLPRIDDTLETLGGSKWFTTLDLACGYWQVEVNPSDRGKTAFAVPTGLYEFETMPFGLANAPATFQRLMHMALKELSPNKCLVYLDDVIVYGRTLEEHLDNLDSVLNCLINAGLKLKPGKCHLLQPEVNFLGHVISASGIRSDPKKIRDVQEWPVPISPEEVRRFLGLASYYRRFVCRFAEIASPLHKLTEKGRKFEWTVECQTAFEHLRQALVSAPILAFPDVSKTASTFILDTDASDTGVGAVLSQPGQDGLEHVIAYASRSLNKHERNYCTTRKEMLALVTYVKYFRHFLLGKRFVVRTDHQALRWLKEFREPEGQVARWQEQLQAFDFECQHRPGRQHTNADALSRRPTRSHGDCPSCQEPHVLAVTLQVPTSDEWAEAQRDDPETKIIYNRLCSHGVKPTKAEIAATSWEAHVLWAAWPRLRLLDGVLYYQFSDNYDSRIVVPQSKVQDVLRRVHIELGHSGQKKMDEAISRRFWWPQQRRDIVNFCNACSECMCMKSPRILQRAHLQSVVTGYPNRIVGVDIIGPLPETPRKNRYILVMVDHFTKWCEAIPIPAADSTTTARTIFEYWIARWGAPEQLHSDRGSNFECLLLRELCQLLGIQKSRTTAYHPQGNGQVERTNRSLKALLKAFTDRTSTRDWDIALPHCLLAYRATVHTSTHHSPHSMVTGRELRLPVDLTLPLTAVDPLLASEYVTKLLHDLRLAHQLARNALSGCQQHQRDYYDRRVHGAPLQPGASVYLHSPVPPPGIPSKFHKEWSGPYIVEEVLSDITCRIRDPGKPDMRSFTVHFNKLKPATQGMPILPSSNRVVTSTEPPEATVHVEISAEGGASTEVAHANIEDNVFLMGGDGVVAKTRHTCNFAHEFPSLAPIPEISTEEGYENTPNE